ncbi:MAG: hypothetical protein V4671_09775 [Armatimonadota bacterium]
MHKALHHLPELDAKALNAKAASWQPLLSSGPGLNRVVVEWSVGKGPSCYVYPAADRSQGVNLAAGIVGTQSDERYADFLEYDFVPKVVSVLEQAEVPVQVRCVDLRPVQTQRARRRVIEAASKAKLGDSAVSHTH